MHTHKYTHTHRYPAPPAVSLSMAHLLSRSDSVSCEIENRDVDLSVRGTTVNTPDYRRLLIIFELWTAETD